MACEYQDYGGNNINHLHVLRLAGEELGAYQQDI
jgi:hypothetical protein